MATHIVSFRIAHDAGYSDRWSSTVDAIRAEAADGTTWEETSSFFLLRSSKSADSLASSIYVGSGFDATKDKLLVVDVSKNAHATRGKVDYPATLSSFFARGLMGSTLLTG